MEKQKEGYGENLIQISLNGSRTPPAETGMLRIGIFKMFSQKDSIWKTFSYFYNAEMECIPFLLKEHLRKCHADSCRVSHNTIENNVKRLLDENLIMVVYTNAGKTKSAYRYRITDKGIKWFLGAMNQDKQWASQL